MVPGVPLSFLIKSPKNADKLSTEVRLFFSSAKDWILPRAMLTIKLYHGNLGAWSR